MRTIILAIALLIAACTRRAELAPAPLPPALDYAEAVARVARVQARDDSVAIPIGRSLLFAHGHRTARVFVLLHGFTDVPTQFEPVGRQLFAGGDNVYIPRLPHHGAREGPIRALGRVRAEALAAFGDSAVDIARGLGDTVVVVGLSAGGAIAGHIAQGRAEVQRAILIAPAIALGGGLSDDDARTVVLLAATLPEITRTNAADSTQPELRKGITTRGLSQVLRLGDQVRERAGEKPPRVKEIVFLLSELDRTVSEDASFDLAQRWFDHGASVVVYRLPAKYKVPHNVMEVAERGGNPAVVYPVVEALARGEAPPPTAARQEQPCGGLWCAVKRALKKS